MVVCVFNSQTTFHIHDDALAEALAQEKAVVAVQFIPFLGLVIWTQPGFLEAKQVGLHQVGVSLHILDMLSQGADIEGGDPQTFHFGIHPAFWVPVEAGLPHPLRLFHHFLVHSNLVRVEVVNDGELSEVTAATQHHVHHAWLVRACHVDHQRVGFAYSLTLKIAAVRYVLENIFYKIKYP